MSLSAIGGLYAIVDDSSANPLDLARRILEGGCRLLQLRAKALPARDFVLVAREMASLCNHYHAIFLVNDRVDVALLSGAHGVHLGQDDFPLGEARKLLGKEKLIGISTNNVEEALDACRDGADYIGFGPLFPTKTKKDARREKGLHALEAVRKKVSIPLIAIGGINEKKIPSLLKAGADGVAIISAIADAKDAKKTTSDIINIIDRCNAG
ncbi:MAG: thiamine phosphate synthase [Deltaproteobacteria bacterium]|nr:thiamine phosphate synthase [Deltaproteobacteria bacterium]